MPALPINQSATLRQGAEIAQALGEGTAMVANPLGGLVDSIGSTVTSGLAGLDSMISSGVATAEEILELEAIESAFDSAVSGASDLFAHADSLLFGDDNGTLISGGIGSNANQALGAINLDDTLNSLGGAITETCDLILDFFGSVLGAGEDLLNALFSAISDAVAFIQNALSQAGQALADAIAAVVNAANSIISAITSAIDEIVQLIADELAQFAEWLAKQLDFSLGSFFAGAQLNPCLQLLLGGVGTAALFGILS